MSILNIVEKAKNDNLEYVLIKNWFQPTPQWDDFKKICDPFKGRESFENREIPDNMKFFLNQCILAYPNIEYGFYTMQDDSFRNARPTGEISGTSFHTDPCDILHWQCRGATEWVIGKNKDIFILEPGDLLWFKSETLHKTENLTEKYSLIFMAGKQVE